MRNYLEKIGIKKEFIFTNINDIYKETIKNSEIFKYPEKKGSPIPVPAELINNEPPQPFKNVSDMSTSYKKSNKKTRKWLL